MKWSYRVDIPGFGVGGRVYTDRFGGVPDDMDDPDLR
jgi:hypothetical protein